MWEQSRDLHGCPNQYNSEFKKMIDNMTSAHNNQYLWWQVAEYTYDGFMIRSRPRG
jgi:TRAP-type mannitol/chloroaromatic compound transport system substrate-binding protein